MESGAWNTLEPDFGRSSKADVKFRALAERFAALSGGDLGDDALRAVDAEVRRVVREVRDLSHEVQQTFIAATYVLADLVGQGWHLQVNGETVSIAAPASIEEDRAAEKARVRRQHSIERAAQLREPAVRAFVREMEAKHLHGDAFRSVFSLMRDGRELSESLSRIRGRCDGDPGVLSTVVRPYLQFVREDRLCEHTGLRLVDIWRYFRHTWANAYKSVPGRTMMVLVRDAAAAAHPVIGIAALSSAAVQISVRDDWIGWSSAVAIARMRQQPSAKYARWAWEVVEQGLKETHTQDLVADGVLTAREFRNPREETLSRLRQEEVEQRDKHNRFMRSGDYKKTTPTADAKDGHWLEQAESHLFRSKRAGLLAKLLHARSVLSQHFGKRPTKEGLRRLLEEPAGRRVMATIVRKAKGDRVGVALADISVCGAVPPYNEILGGKLVAMLLASPEVAEAYRDRYRNACSVIASSMAGRRVVRRADLVFLGTTSLYRVGSSQYNRVRIPCDEVGGREGETLTYHELGVTEGYGTFHISRGSAAALTRLLQQNANGRRVHNIFGEGVNPRLRHIRDGIAAIGFPCDQLLKHGSPRIVYGVPLARNFQDYLIGLAKRADYYLPLRDPSATTRAIADWWARRWLPRRIQSDEVLGRVASHSLVHPIRHGARVELPEEDPNQGVLF
jgi:hypothetical protein